MIGNPVPGTEVRVSSTPHRKELRVLSERPDIRIAVIYALAASAWILLSDSLMFLLFPDVMKVQTVGTLKGLGFVIVTSGILYLLLRRAHREQLRKQEEITGLNSRLLEDIAQQRRQEEERRRMREEREELLMRLQMHIDRMPIGYIVTDRNFRFVYLNPAAEQMFGYVTAELKGKQPYGHIIPAELRTDVEQARSAWSNGSMLAHGTNRNITRDGRTIHCEWFNTPVLDRNGEFLQLISMVQDVTVRLQYEHDLLESRTRLRALAARLDKVREEERIHLSREIHDGLGQSLTGLKIDLSLMKRVLHLDHEAQDDITEIVGSMERILDETIVQARQLARQLRPGMLDEVGIAEAVRQHMTEFRQRSGMRVTMQLPDGKLPLSDARQLALYRITQEAVTNIVRHAEARSVDVALGIDGGVVSLEIRDDGRGISEEDMLKSASLGIIGMTERAEQLGGNCRVRRGEDGGTVLRVEMPALPEELERE
jgi:PAS domain S-box-containing protein